MLDKIKNVSCKKIARDESYFSSAVPLLLVVNPLNDIKQCLSLNARITVAPTHLHFQLTAQGRARAPVQPLFCSNQQLSWGLDSGLIPHHSI